MDPGRDQRASSESLQRALTELAAGRFVLVVDDEDRENEGDLIMAAEHATADSIAFMLRRTSGLLCADEGDDPRGTAFTVTVDLKHRTSTGISAEDRALTARALADPDSVATDFCRPGHVPLAVVPNEHNRRYLRTNALRMQHDLSLARGSARTSTVSSPPNTPAAP